MSEVTVTIGWSKFRYWQAVSITRSLDAVDAVGLSAPFEPSSRAFRDTFRPFTYPDIQVDVDGAQLFDGTLVGVDPAYTADASTVSVSAYSRPGVLGDCTLPESSLPSEYRGLSLSTLAAVVCEPFGLSAQFDAPAGAVFDKVACDVGQSPLDFLSKLAAQRGLLVTSTSAGRLRFWRVATPGQPVAVLEQGKPGPLVGVKATFDPQAYYSEVTGLQPVRPGSSKTKRYTARNPRLPGVVRPYVYTVDDAAGGDLAVAVPAKFGRMLAASVRYSASVATWYDAGGKLWAPNTYVRLYAPGVMVYEPTLLLVAGVTLRKDADAETAELDLVLPEAYGDTAPARLPWEG